VYIFLIKIPKCLAYYSNGDQCKETTRKKVGEKRKKIFAFKTKTDVTTVNLMKKNEN
jgi:hypothetical protein